VREGFLKLAKLTQGVVVVNAGETVETVEEHIRRAIEKRL
jgi:thymidylate kinase